MFCFLCSFSLVSSCFLGWMEESSGMCLCVSFSAGVLRISKAKSCIQQDRGKTNDSATTHTTHTTQTLSSDSNNLKKIFFVFCRFSEKNNHVMGRWQKIRFRANRASLAPIVRRRRGKKNSRDRKQGRTGSHHPTAATESKSENQTGVDG